MAAAKGSRRPPDAIDRQKAPGTAFGRPRASGEIGRPGFIGVPNVAYYCAIFCRQIATTGAVRAPIRATGRLPRQQRRRYSGALGISTSPASSTIATLAPISAMLATAALAAQNRHQRRGGACPWTVFDS